MPRHREATSGFFGAEAHIGVDRKGCHRAFGVYLSCFGIGGAHASDLLHAAEKMGLGLRCAMNYQGQMEAIHAAAPEAQDMTSRRTRRKHAVDEVERRKNRAKARVRSKVEWFFRILRRVFGYTKLRYRGLKRIQNFIAPQNCERRRGSLDNSRLLYLEFVPSLPTQLQ